MRKFNLIPQERNNYCICSVLQGILKDNGFLEVTQGEIAKNLTPSKKGFLIQDNKIKRFMKDYGFDYNFYWYNETPFNEPETLLEEISVNSGFFGVGIHTYRVLNFEDPKIFSDDPKDSSEKVFHLYGLMDDMRKNDGGFGLIRKLK